ncbi:DUF222 domain-containing protein [Pseudactinotalea sp.]|uniref:HNH endonuclease signature motif containing protein n=1 Tax=Pseudactinotalea sp. TaxID=1926260 RepID=UPI003B39FC0E
MCRAAVAELGVALGVSTQAAQTLSADALELAYRLPYTWARVVAGEVKPWRARLIAQRTRPLSRLAAAYVDRQIAALAHHATGPQLEGLIEAAMSRFDPELATELAAARNEQRRFEIHLDETGINGLTPVGGVIDLPDAQDLEAALSHSATQLALWGSEESLDARRARALGELAREHLTLVGEPATDRADHAVMPQGAELARQSGRAAPTKRQAILYVHLTDAAIREAIAGRASGSCGRVENTGKPVTADTIREWIGDAHTKVSIRPVLDLAEQMHADSYEFPARMREQIRLRQGTCIFPGCRAKGLYAQIDHRVPYDHDDPARGGQTETCNGHLLCQRHHNLKTHHGFWYTVLSDGAVLWRTPHGLRIRRNPDGTVDYLSRYRSRYEPDDDEANHPSGTSAARRRTTAPPSPDAPIPGFDQRARDTSDDPPPPF